MSIHTAEISNLRDFLRPRPTLLHVWVKKGGGGGEEEKHRSCQAGGVRWCLIQATKSFASYTKSVMSGTFRGLRSLSLVFSEHACNVMTHGDVPTSQETKEALFRQFVGNSTHLVRSYRHQKWHCPG